MESIPLLAIEGFRIGQTEDVDAATGVTVVVVPEGAAAGQDVRGGGPASRESELLKPLAAASAIHAIVLGGGSAFGLDAAGGVMENLEKRGIGLDVGVTRVPLVCQSDIFDLAVGACDVRPDKAMGYAACDAAFAGERGNYRDGNYGVGIGASVGKLGGMPLSMKAGIGSAAVQVGDVQVGALVVVNAAGNVYDRKTGAEIAGMRMPQGAGFVPLEVALSARVEPVENVFTSNTTLAVVFTNAAFEKPQLCKIAGMAHDGMARSIRPVHTSADGDTIYALSVGSVRADIDMVGSVAADVLSDAIECAVRSAEGAYGLPSVADL